jgi:hypothetical protein
MAAISNIKRRERIEELEGAALTRIGRIIASGSDKDALVAIDIVLRRTMPEPKVSAADIAKAAALGAGAGATGLAAIASKAQARLAAPIHDATFQAVEPDRQPLVDVSTLSKGAKE